MSEGKVYKKYLGKSKNGWRNDYNKKNIFEKAASNRYKNLKYSIYRN